MTHTLPPAHAPARLRALLISLAIVLSASAAHAHGGEDHEHGPAVVAPAASQPTPRASAQTDSFELVAALQPGEPPVLLLYLDDFDTNTPIPDAEVELESGPFKARAKAISPGVYAVPAGAFAQAGTYPLTVSVQAGERADLLDATLTVAPPQPDAPGTGTPSPRQPLRWAVAAIVGALALITLGWRLGRKTGAAA